MNDNREVQESKDEELPSKGPLIEFGFTGDPKTDIAIHEAIKQPEIKLAKYEERVKSLQKSNRELKNRNKKLEKEKLAQDPILQFLIYSSSLLVMICIGILIDRTFEDNLPIISLALIGAVVGGLVLLYINRVST
ncbi:MAG: hypothetical protein ACE5OZ_06175 [Candidatus Heimdallarchaeota archaeon]